MNDYEARLAEATKVCRKWLMKAPVWPGSEQDLLAEGQDDTTHWAGMRPRAEMLRAWIEEFDSFLSECARSVAIGGGYPGEGRLRFNTGIDTRKMKAMRKIPHEDAVVKGNSDGDFYEVYNGSVYRRDRSGSLIIIRWRLERTGSWG
ncbi:hypothetical protein [Streptomyces noursei]|uniref:hypothetical protein n=1 Tax=Streptomyces noursei TaxID=1971 RepID=UPI001965A31F|nr:hypothetical protein [Streptomyces noursei]QRX95672.1 hypothetical protein JNO44_37195 [Streptomyces noursei]